MITHTQSTSFSVPTGDFATSSSKGEEGGFAALVKDSSAGLQQQKPATPEQAPEPKVEAEAETADAPSVSQDTTAAAGTTQPVELETVAVEGEQGSDPLPTATGVSQLSLASVAVPVVRVSETGLANGAALAQGKAQPIAKTMATGFAKVSSGPMVRSASAEGLSISGFGATSEIQGTASKANAASEMTTVLAGAIGKRSAVQIAGPRPNGTGPLAPKVEAARSGAPAMAVALSGNTDLRSAVSEQFSADAELAKALAVTTPNGSGDTALRNQFPGQIPTMQSPVESARIFTPAVSAEAPDLSAPPDVQLRQHVAQQIQTLQTGENRMRFSLSPYGMGEIEVEVLRSENGRMQIAMTTESASVLNVLRQDREQLLEALQSRGITADTADLDFQTFGERGRQDGRNAHGLSLEDETGEPVAHEDDAPDDPAAPSRSTLPGQLDILT